MNLPTFERNIAITDIEFTGLDPDQHEIIEIGLLLMRQGDLKIIDELSIKVRPEHIGTADLESLAIAGYSEEEWENVATLKEALEQYAEKVEGAIFLAHPLTMDWSFLNHAFKKIGIENPMHYYQLDLSSMAWVLLNEEEALPKVTLIELVRYFDIEPEPTPHRAINGAKIAYEILKKLLELKKVS